MRNKVHGLVHGVNPIELKERLDGDSEFVLLDVRRDEEYNAVHSKDSRTLHIPLVDLKRRLAEIPEGKEVIIYCLIRVRAYNVERTLRGLGFDNFKTLDGSLVAWPFPEYLTSGRKR